jgi:hypothetical protein
MQRRSLVHRITAWVALLGYALVAAGLPLPMGAAVPGGSDSPAARRLAAKDRSQPFPCMDKPCGCTTAAQCFANCCCNTPAELLAWARANRIDPGVRLALERRAASSCRTAARPPREPGCCAAKPPPPKPDCCATAPQPTCCAAVARTPGLEPTPAGPDAPPMSAHTVVLRSMLACGGVVAQWLAVASALPPPPVGCTWDADPIAVIFLIDESSLGERAAPESPPPRMA